MSISSINYAGDFALKSYVRTVYPENIRSKRDLINYIIEGTGYQLYFGENAPRDSRYILSQTPDYQRYGVLMSRTDALLMAVGDKNSILIDHSNKYISVTRSPINDLH